jgi:glucose-1-phosphate thymidylyltransferase
VLASPTNKGEYYLTDAFQHMIEHGRRILTAEVGGWYDCGKLDTLLETNEILLKKGSARRKEFPGVTIYDPVLIQDGVTIERSVIGPNVTLEAGTRVVNSRLEHVIVGTKSVVLDSTLHHSMLGDRVSIRGLKGVATLGDDSEVDAA